MLRSFCPLSTSVPHWPAAALLVTLVLITPLPAAELGGRMDAFQLPDIHGRDRSLAELADKPVVVVAFLGAECPLARLYGPRLQAMSEEYAERGVAFIGIDSNQQDSLLDMTTFVRQSGLKFPLLKDRDQSVAEQFGAVRNPEVFVLDSQRAIRYRGRVDDQYGRGSSSGYAKSKISRRDLASALDELLAGREVSQPSTEVRGCLIGHKSKTKPRGEVTYTKHIAGLLQDRCVSCHRAGQIGPFALTDYEEVVGWAEMLREVVSEGRMPPWSANPEYGHFSNDARLSDDEKKLLDTWVENGCPQGNPADLPEPRTWTEGWQIQKPDQVMKMAKAFTVPAEGVVSYQMFQIDPGWTEDKWIQAAEVQPGNRAVVHHIIAFVVPPGGRGRGRSQQEGAGQGRGGIMDGAGLTAYVPGHNGSVYKPGVAEFVPAGSKIVFQMHYTPNGTEQEDQSYLGVVFADPKTVKKRVHGGAALNRGFVIEPHESSHEVTAERELKSDQLLLWLSPHMHLRGKSFRFEARYPDGTAEILLDVPKYDFNWQIHYQLAEPKLLPAGTTLQCTAHFDNSENNAANPDPTDTVRWGPQTWHEMMIGFFATVAVEDDAHVEKQVAAE